MSAITMPSTTEETSTDTKTDSPPDRENAIEEIPQEKLPEHLREEENDEETIQNPSTTEKAMSYASGLLGKAKDKTRQLHNRSAKKDAQRSSKSAERIAAEVSGATTAVIKTSLSGLLGGLVGTAKGLFSGMSPTSLKRLRMEEPGDMNLIGEWVASEKLEREGQAPTGLLQFEWTDETAQEHFEEVIALTDATETEVELPGGDTKPVVAIPIESDGSGDADEGQPIGYIVAVNTKADRRTFLFRDE